MKNLHSVDGKGHSVVILMQILMREKKTRHHTSIVKTCCDRAIHQSKFISLKLRWFACSYFLLHDQFPTCPYRRDEHEHEHNALLHSVILRKILPKSRTSNWFNILFSVSGAIHNHNLQRHARNQQVNEKGITSLGSITLVTFIRIQKWWEQDAILLLFLCSRESSTAESISVLESLNLYVWVSISG